MKRIKPYVFALLVIMTVMCLSACGRSNNDETTGTTENATNQTTTSAGTMESTTRVNDTTNTNDYNEESTGVIDGVIHDVEKGVDDITGESNGHPTDAATETTMAR